MNADPTDSAELRDAGLRGRCEALEAALTGASLETSLGVLIRTAKEALGSNSQVAFYVANGEGGAMHLAAGDMESDPPGAWGLPIYDPEGQRIGALQVSTGEPRAAAERELDLAALLAQTAAVLIARGGASRSCERAEKTLSESEERFRALIKATPDVVYRISADWSKMHQLVGREFLPDTLEPDETWLATYIHPDDQPQLLEAIQRAIEAKGIFELEHRVIQVDGSLGWAYSRAIPILDRDGEIVEWFGAASDVTKRKEAEETLRESEEHLRSALDAAGMGRWRADLLTGRGTRDANLNQILGLRAVETTQPIGDRFRLVHPDDKPAAIAVWQRAVETKGVYENEFRVIREGGGEVWLRETGQFVEGQGRATGSMTGLTQDITRRKAAEEALRESEARFRMLADNMSQLAWTCDELGNVNWYNRRWLDYTGLTFEQMSDWGWMKVHHPDHVDRVVASVTRSRESGEFWEDTFPLRGADGEYRWFLSRAFPIRNERGEVVRWFGTNTDVTELRETQAALREADRRKDEFLAMLAHELRNPLAPILSGLELLQTTGEQRPDFAEVRGMMERQTRHLIALVDDLLDVSRITRNRLELRKRHVNLADVIRSAVEASHPFMVERKHRLAVSIPDRDITVDVDPHRLAQVVANLLNNAAKYTPQDGSVALTAEQAGKDLILSVKDTGVGIRADMLDRIFEMFAQADPPAEMGQAGLGIGLTLVKRLVELHAGTIEAHSGGYGGGSEFVVRLPVVVEAPELQPSPPASAEAPKSLRVLVVDDNKDAADTLAIVVGMLGKDVRVAYDGTTGVKLADQYRPDVVLLDLGMPRMDGYEVARRLREHDWGRTLTLVALTGWGQDEDKRRTAQAGFDLHVVKPVDLPDLRKLFAGVSGAALAREA